jgi:hypothetical protein
MSGEVEHRPPSKVDEIHDMTPSHEIEQVAGRTT